MKGDVYRVARHARILNHLLSNHGLSSNPICEESFLPILVASVKVLASSTDRSCVTTKEAVFASEWLKTRALASNTAVPQGKPSSERSGASTDDSAVRDLICVLQPTSTVDKGIAAEYVVAFSERIMKDKMSAQLEQVRIWPVFPLARLTMQNLATLLPWAPFFEAPSAEKLLDKIVKRGKKGLQLGEDGKKAIGALVTVLSDVKTAFRYLDLCVSLDLYSPLLHLLEKGDVADRPLPETEDVQVDTATVNRFIASNNPAPLRLLRVMVDRFPQAFAAARTAIQALDLESGQIPAGLVPVVAAIIQVDPALFDGESSLAAACRLFCQKLVDTRTEADAHGNDVVRILAVLADRPKSPLGAVLRESVSINTFSATVSQLVETLAASKNSEKYHFMGHLVEVGLQVAVRTCSSDGSLEEPEVALLNHLGKLIEPSH